MSEPPQWEAQPHAQPHAQPPLAPQEQPLSADTLGWGSPTDIAGGVVPTSSFAAPPQPVRVDELPAAASSPTDWEESMEAKAAWLAGRRGSLRWMA